MRSFVAILLISVAGCGAPSYSLRSASSMPLYAVNDSPPPAGELSTVPRTIVLLPPVRHGHSVQWKTGAIITGTSLGVALLGGGLLALGMLSTLNHPLDTNNGMVIAGSVFSAIGGAGTAIAGPLVWMGGIGGPPDPN